MFIDERPAPSTPVTCGVCGVGVLVRKNTYEQTVVQWRGPEETCHRPDVAGTTRLRRGCPALRRSIEEAVLDGALRVENPGAPEPEPGRCTTEPEPHD